MGFMTVAAPSVPSVTSVPSVPSMVASVIIMAMMLILGVQLMTCMIVMPRMFMVILMSCGMVAVAQVLTMQQVPQEQC